MRIAVLMIAFGALAACATPIPYPHRFTTYPAIEGLLKRGDEPIRNTTIAISVKGEPGSCEPEDPRVQTDDQGRFSFAKRSKKSWVLWAPLLPVHRIFEVAVCVDEGERTRPLMLIRDYAPLASGIGPLPDQVEIDCDLSVAGEPDETWPFPTYCDGVSSGGRLGDERLFKSHRKRTLTNSP
jgi:hypothetical protein